MIEPTETAASPDEAALLGEPAAVAAKLLTAELGRVIIGQDEPLRLIGVALLAGGHALLEGVPGTAKTLTVRALARLIGGRDRRIQFTPDLMPSDIIGTNIYNARTAEFELRKGPIFTDLLLGDEINRAPAKTQSALLEAMSERHATIDGVRHELSPVFTVFATQNPVEFEGTYPLPEASRDRFLVKVQVGYPAAAAERDILAAVDAGRPLDQSPLESLRPVMDLDTLAAARALLPRVRCDGAVVDYMLAIVRATRGDDRLAMGAGPRGGIDLLRASKARALLLGRAFVTPDDVAALVAPVLAHRVVLSAEAEIAGDAAAEVLDAITDSIEVPR